MVARSVDEVSGAIDRFIHKAKTGGAGRRHIAVKYLEQDDSDVSSFIALRRVIDSLTLRKKPLQGVAVRFGTALINMILQTGLVEFADQINSRRDAVMVLHLTKPLAAWVEAQISKSELINPAYMPIWSCRLWTGPTRTTVAA